MMGKCNNTRLFKNTWVLVYWKMFLAYSLNYISKQEIEKYIYQYFIKYISLFLEAMLLKHYCRLVSDKQNESSCHQDDTSITVRQGCWSVWYTKASQLQL